jgi:hypothetical protein
LSPLVASFFFYFDLFVIIIIEMNPTKHFFPNLALLSLANPSGVTYEGVTPVHLARLKGLMWRHVGWDD